MWYPVEALGICRSPSDSARPPFARPVLVRLHMPRTNTFADAVLKRRRGKLARQPDHHAFALAP